MVLFYPWGFALETSPIRPMSTSFPEETAKALQGTKIWVIDALRYNAHKTHFNVETALSWIERIRARAGLFDQYAPRS